MVCVNFVGSQDHLRDVAGQRSPSEGVLHTDEDVPTAGERPSPSSTARRASPAVAGLPPVPPEGSAPRPTGNGRGIGWPGLTAPEIVQTTQHVQHHSARPADGPAGRTGRRSPRLADRPRLAPSAQRRCDPLADLCDQRARALCDQRARAQRGTLGVEQVADAGQRAEPRQQLPQPVHGGDPYRGENEGSGDQGDERGQVQAGDEGVALEGVAEVDNALRGCSTGGGTRRPAPSCRSSTCCRRC